ncbi:LPXTG cell wall anchor domain-containing protein [Bifidobacterium sp. ESL0775]|uniref:LPXTG cell wall anchor domain-containing protein n=1 Tax=Bifidobacterium sp. ESL0775 TaxID=2983230 RepID=UPI0023F80F59|nr:LPXTG cell wall anchor domain-containing protein [Bifidobacterium sp. ESL0775]WEV69162.1 LPXTG cell wall anchor domain-containing protein [Bifidobacterium sp. ESL0775]
MTTRMRNACRGAINNAIADPTDGPASQARVVGVMMTVSASSYNTIDFWGTGGADFMNRFHNDWNAANPAGSLIGWDAGWLMRAKSMFEAGINAQAAATPGGVQVVCLAVNNQQPPRYYDLSVSTNQQAPAGLKVGATDAISDVIHTSRNGSPIAENVNANVVLRYDGQPDGYVSSRSATKGVTVANQGDAWSPRFSPSDLGMTHWQEGRYWFDVQVAQQGHMRNGVDTPDREASEQWGVASVAPPAPGKAIGQGTSVHDMANTTTIESQTGRGGYELHFKDVIDPHGQRYDIRRMKVKDVTASTDVSAEFTMAWNRATDTVAANRVASKGEMPLDHLYQFSFDVVMDHPKTDRAGDQASVIWNTMPAQDTVHLEFPTREPAPNKAWAKSQDEAAAMDDPGRTNDKGSDNKTFVTGDDISSVVNGVLPMDTIQDLDSYSITDDWTPASGYVDFSDVSKARVLVDDHDMTSSFTVANTGTVTTATAKPVILTGSRKQLRDRKVKLILNGTVRMDVDAHTTITVTNRGSESWNGHTNPTNEPPVLIWSPNPDKSWVKLDSAGHWQTVIDPSKSNATGADNLTFLDGDQLAAVVNLPVADPSNLAQKLSRLTLTDDYGKADYLVDPQVLSKVRVYAADATRSDQSFVAGINGSGVDVTDKFDITQSGTAITATAKAGYLVSESSHHGPLQFTLLVPFTANYANGGGAKKVREDFHKEPGDELAFCTNPDGTDLLNAGSVKVNRQGKDTNLPKVCGYVPPVKKDVVSEASQGGGQESVDGKAVYPGQKVEYDLDTQPHLPSLAYMVKTITLTDKYDRYLKPDKQTLELMDLNTGRMIAKSKYTNRWDDTAHEAAVDITDAALIAQWQAGGTPRIQLRFEGTAFKGMPAGHRVSNQWVLALNDSLTPSNVVFNIPPSLNPVKHDNQSAHQGDPGVSIDGKTLLKGDTGNYVIDLDATQANPAYKVWKLGIVDDFDEQYLTVDPTGVTVTGDDGYDHTAGFNIQISDGVLYAFAKRVDTLIPATGQTVRGDPQPTDLKAYSDSDAYDPLTDPAIDQTLLGQHYHVTLPYTVTKVTDGYVVKNKAMQVENDVRKETNEVSNPLKPINPVKDVVVSVGGESVNGSSVYKDSAFLYRLDSSILPANRAYPSVDVWKIADKLDPAYDEYTGQWAVYATRDLYAADGRVLAAKGHRIAGNGFDSSAFDGDMFTLEAAADGTMGVEATPAYRQLASADVSHEQGWCAYLQVRRLKATERHENRFTEAMNGKVNESNVVWTRTPELIPSLHIEKWDKLSGWSTGDRDDPRDSLLMMGDTDIVFTVTNTSDNEGGHGPVFRAKDLKITDTTISGDGAITSLKYPRNWSTLVLRPGDHVDVVGTLKDVASKHRDRAKVTGVPLAELPAVDRDPWGEDSGTGIAKRDARGGASARGVESVGGGASAGGSALASAIPSFDSTLLMGAISGSGFQAALGPRGSAGSEGSGGAILQEVQTSPDEEGIVDTKTFTRGEGEPSAEIDGNVMRVMRPVASNLDDWNGYNQRPLASTGASIVGAALVTAVLIAGAAMLMFMARHRYRPRHQ